MFPFEGLVDQMRRSAQVTVVSSCLIHVGQRHERMTQHALHPAGVQSEFAQAPVGNSPRARESLGISREIRIPKQSLGVTGVAKVRTLRSMVTEKAVAVRVLRASGARPGKAQSAA